MKNNKQFTKVVCSITHMASAIELSRARFYQLLDAGILPQPIYDIRTKRPYYNLELQEQCLRVKATGIGINQQYILFYSPRKNTQDNAQKHQKKKVSKHQDLVETLNVMGLEVSGSQVESALSELYPKGYTNVQDQGLVVREIFRFIKQSSV